MPGRSILNRGTACRPSAAGIVWMTALLGLLVWLDHRHQGVFLVPPFAATMTILLYLPDVTIAQPFPIVFGSTCGAALGTLLAGLFGPGAGVAMLAALVALIVLPLLRAYHPPGIALAMYPALLHTGLWFTVATVLPFTLAMVASAAAMSRAVPGWPRYPAPPSDPPANGSPSRSD